MRKQMIETAAFEVATQVRASRTASKMHSRKLPSCRADGPGPRRHRRRHGDRP